MHTPQYSCSTHPPFSCLYSATMLILTTTTSSNPHATASKQMLGERGKRQDRVNKRTPLLLSNVVLFASTSPTSGRLRETAGSLATRTCRMDWKCGALASAPATPFPIEDPRMVSRAARVVDDGDDGGKATFPHRGIQRDKRPLRRFIRVLHSEGVLGWFVVCIDQ